MKWDIRDLYSRLTPDEIHHPLLVPLLAVARWCMVFYLQLVKDRAFIQAAAMAYQTLIALVPMLLLVFGVLGATGLVAKDREALEALIFETFIADIPQVREFIMRGIGDLDLTALGIIGVAGLVIFAGRLFLMAEHAYNFTFGTRVRRGWGYRLLNFWFALTVIPAILSLAFLATLELATDFGVGAFVRQIVEPLIMFSILLGALKLFPTVPVRWGPAAMGAGISTAGIWAARGLFRLYLNWFKADDPLLIVYGSVGLIPVFLLWLYLVWVLVLLGVEVAYVAQNFRSLWEIERSNLESRNKPLRGPQLHTALEVMAWVGWHFEEGLGPMPTEEVARRVRIPRREVNPVLELLKESGFLIPSDDGWTLSKPTEHLRLAHIVEAWSKGAGANRGPHSDLSPAELAIQHSLERSLPPTLADAIDRWVRPELKVVEAG